MCHQSRGFDDRNLRKFSLNTVGKPVLVPPCLSPRQSVLFVPVPVPPPSPVCQLCGFFCGGFCLVVPVALAPFSARPLVFCVSLPSLFSHGSVPVAPVFLAVCLLFRHNKIYLLARYRFVSRSFYCCNNCLALHFCALICFRALDVGPGLDMALHAEKEA